MGLKIGRFGPYVETANPGEEKPKRSSLPKGWSPATLALEQALRLLALPREVGIHPEDGKPITAGLGRYGPFVQHAGTYANVSDIDEVFEVGLNRAVALLAEKRDRIELVLKGKRKTLRGLSKPSELAKELLEIL